MPTEFKDALDAIAMIAARWMVKSDVGTSEAVESACRMFINTSYHMPHEVKLTPVGSDLAMHGGAAVLVLRKFDSFLYGNLFDYVHTKATELTVDELMRRADERI